MKSYDAIVNGKTFLGIELGSTRIKATLIADDHLPIASGSHAIESRYEDGVWTYRLDDVWAGTRACYHQLNDELLTRYAVPLRTVGAIGISGMMHGYLPFDRAGTLLTPFRTWRNTSTGPAAAHLSALFRFPIPQRWSIAHLYQAILNNEPHVAQIAHLTTLAGYVHWQLTGQQVLGVGEASGMFPIDSATNDYQHQMVERFDQLTRHAAFPWQILDILPRVLVAGEHAGHLSERGARLLDPDGQLQPGVPCCPPEGDAGTGMVATNSIAERTGNVSAGTSVFAMFVLERPLTHVHPEIDIVTTPVGRPVAMVHSNNFTSELNTWVDLFAEFSQLLAVDLNHQQIYELLYQQALCGEPDAGGLLAYNYLAGEHITQMDEGRPLLVRTPASRLTLANFVRVQLFSALGGLKLGLDILFEQEQVHIDQLLGHGGFFKTQAVSQRMMAAATGVPVSVMTTAGEGGPWGMALLAAYAIQKRAGESLEAYLRERVFAEQQVATVHPDPRDVAGFATFMERYTAGLAIERAAVAALR